MLSTRNSVRLQISNQTWLQQLLVYKDPGGHGW